MSAGNVRSSFSSTATTFHAPKKFEDRAALALSWFEGWSEAKRWRFLERLLSLSSEKHLRRVHHALEAKVPKGRVDFTRHLPHFLCLHILGQLDPKTLCRASQVCWYWRVLCEDNSLWRVKCLRYGWALPQPPTDYELGVWKRHYVMCVHNLHWVPPKTLPHGYHGDTTKDDLVEDPPLEDDTDTETVSSVFTPAVKGEEFVHHGNSESAVGVRRPPWRVTARKPEELIKSTILWTSQSQKKQQNRTAPAHPSHSQSALPAAQKGRSSLNKVETSIHQSMSTPSVGGAKGEGRGPPVNDRVLHSMSVGNMQPLGDSVEEKVVRPETQKGITAWLRESERSELPQALNHPTLRKTLSVSSQQRSGEGEKLTDKHKALPSRNLSSVGGDGGTADTQPSARKASVVKSAWQLTRQSKDGHLEPNKTAILQKPWQPSHAGHVTVHDSDVSDDESV